MLEDPVFPPLLKGHPVEPGVTAYGVASAKAAAGEAGAGDLFWSRSEDRLSLAIVLEPDVPAARAAQMHLLMMVAFGDAFGAIAPPEIAIHYRWPGAILVNGAVAGQVRTVMDPTMDDNGAPGWMVTALDVAIALDLSQDGPGERLDTTTLHEEGAGEVDRTLLVNSVARHFLTWVDTWQHEGFKPVHGNWTGRMEEADRPVTIDQAAGSIAGTMTGLDEDGNLLLRKGEGQVGSVLLADAVARWQP